LIDADRTLYSLDEASEEKLEMLIRESLQKGENILLENFKDKKYVFEANLEYDY